MSTKKLILSIVFLSSILSLTPMNAAEETLNRQAPQNPDPSLNLWWVGKFNVSHLVIISLFAAACRLYWKDPKPEPDYYNFENFKKFIHVQLLLTCPQEYFANVWDFVDNFLIGQYFKDKFMKWKADGTIKQSRKCPMSGVGGYIVSGFQTTEKAQKLVKHIFRLVTTLTMFELAKKGGLFTNMSLYSLDRERPAAGRYTPYEEAILEQHKRNADSTAQQAKATETLNKLLMQYMQSQPSAPKQDMLYPKTLEIPA